MHSNKICSNKTIKAALFVTFFSRKCAIIFENSNIYANTNFSVRFINARCSNTSAALRVAIVSVRPSLCLSVHHRRALWQIERTYCRYFDTNWNSEHSSLLNLTAFRGRLPLLPKICGQSDPSLRQTARNVSVVRASENVQLLRNRLSTTGCPLSYRWTAYITFDSPKGAPKMNLLTLRIKLDFYLIKSATKFLCVKTFRAVL